MAKVKAIYTKAAYQEANRTPFTERTPEQELLATIDFRQGPIPIYTYANGQTAAVHERMEIEDEITLQNEDSTEASSESSTETAPTVEDEKVVDPVGPLEPEDVKEMSPAEKAKLAINKSKK